MKIKRWGKLHSEKSNDAFLSDEIDLEKTEAKLEHGILEIIVPKHEPEKETKKKLTVN